MRHVVQIYILMLFPSKFNFSGGVIINVLCFVICVSELFFTIAKLHKIYDVHEKTNGHPLWRITNPPQRISKRSKIDREKVVLISTPSLTEDVENHERGSAKPWSV